MISEFLGEGAMGSVYRARDSDLLRDVALKVVRERPEDSPDKARRARERLFKEARVAAALEHPNAVRIYDVGEIEGVAFIAMELVKGRTLRTFVDQRTGAMAARCSWLGDVARVLASAHARGLLHRDIKPENVMLDETGTIKVFDFGIARSISLDDEGHAGAGASAQSRFLGTPLYMAPELHRGERIDARADQFSWGVVAFELLAGVPPWPRDGTVLTVASRILSTPGLPIRELAPQVPPELASVITRALAKDRRHRFASMVDLLDAWEAATNRAGVEDVAGHPDAPPPSSPEGAPGEPQSPTTAVLTNLAYEMRGDLAIVVHNDRTPTDEDHFATLDIMRRARAGTVKRALTVTSGGTPTALQRKSYNEALAGHEMLTAIVSDKAVVRRVVALLTWHNSNIRAFSRKKIDQALTFLGVPSEDRPEVLRRVHFLETELSRRPRRGR